MSGFLEDLSPKQEEILNDFKENINDIINEDHDDRLFLQFLRARHFDLKKAELMFRKHVEWRKTNPLKFLRDEYKTPEVLEKYIPIKLLGFDKKGSAVLFFPAGAYDLKGMVNACTTHEIGQHIFHALEKGKKAMTEYNKKFNRHVDVQFVIFDLGGMKFSSLLHRPVLTPLMDLMRQYEANYPETLKCAYIANSPYFMSWIFGVLKMIADVRTINKIRCFGSTGFMEALQEHIDADILPDWLGHPNYVSICNVLTSIPQKYYIRSQNKLHKDTENVQQVNLKRRSRQELPMFVEGAGSTIHWSVECAYGDINVGLFYKNREDSERNYEGNIVEEMVPFSRAGGDFGSIDGSFINKKTGTYVLVLDNSFSFIRSKCVTYKFDVVPPVTKMIQENSDIEDYEVLNNES